MPTLFPLLKGGAGAINFIKWHCIVLTLFYLKITFNFLQECLLLKRNPVKDVCDRINIVDDVGSGWNLGIPPIVFAHVV